MNDVLRKYWWILSLRGLFGVLFGIIALTRPGVAFMSLVYLFGAYLVADGLATLSFGARDYGGGRRWGFFVAEGLLTALVGVLTWLMPTAAAFALLLWIALWAIVTGGLELAAAVRLRRVLAHDWALALAGVCSLAFGVLLARYPYPGAVAVTLLLGGYALAFGVLFIALGFEARRLALRAP